MSTSSTTSSTTSQSHGSHQMAPVPESDEIGITLNPYLNGKPTARAVPDLYDPNKLIDVTRTGKILQRMKRITNETVDILTNLVIVLQNTCDYDQTFRFVLQFNLEDNIIFDCLLNPEWKGRPISAAN